MTLLFRLCFAIPLLLLLGIFGVFALCIESSPLVAEQAPLSAANIERVKHILRQHRSENVRSGETKTITLSEEELNLLANHLAHRLNIVDAVLSIKEGLLALKSTWDISAFLPYKSQVPRYLNIDAVIGSSSGDAGLQDVNIQTLNIGQMTLPSALIKSVLQIVIEHIDALSLVQEGKKMIRVLDIGTKDVALTYQWRADSIERLRGRLVTGDERRVLAVYQQFLVSEVERQGRTLTFTHLVEATFRFAQRRSKSADPVAENKAAIIVLAAYANGGGLSRLIPEARDWPKPQKARLRLHGRRDLVKHFMTSSALTVAGGGAMSNAIGLRKEMDDASSGSGFSFIDLAADRAGVYFAEHAVSSVATASALQARLAKGRGNTRLMGDINGLEENLSKMAFERRYGGPGDQRYEQVVGMIDHRINDLMLYRRD
jgi:uncharacterized protein YfiM (DUF2279 family)